MRPVYAGPQSSNSKFKGPVNDIGKQAPAAKGEFFSQQAGVSAVTKQVETSPPQLKPTTTVDKSQPQISADVHVKKVDRKPFLDEVSQDHELSHVDEVADRSEPKIGADVHVKKSDRGAFLASVTTAAQEKGVGEDDE